MLNELRFGQLSGKSIAKFNALRRAVSYDDGIEPTQLCVCSASTCACGLVEATNRCALRNEVDRANNDRLVRIKTSVRDFYSEDRGEGIDDDARDKLLDNLLAPKKLSLKPGAQVMYLKNSPDLGLVNGTLGKVVRFAPNGHAGPEDMDLDDDENLGAGMNEWDAPVVRVKREKTPTASNGRSADDVPWVEWNLPGKPVRPVGREEFKIEANGQLRAARKQVRPRS